jgi:uncharacterized cupredoxin-like copper-binding protein
MQHFRTFFVSIALIGALSACSNSPSVQEITVDAEPMLYQPATIEVIAGQPVRLTLANGDTVEHDLSILEMPTTAMSTSQDPMAGHNMSGMATQPDLHMVASAGGSAQVEFTPSKPGTYEFICTLAGHKEAGMHGTLTVKAP